jgi:hypothetical protein
MKGDSMLSWTIKRWLVWTVLLGGFLFFSPSLTSAQSSPGYTLKTYTLSGGGELTTSPDYILMAAIGQSSPVGISTSDHYVHHAGFWYTVQLKRMLFLPLILKE